MNQVGRPDPGRVAGYTLLRVGIGVSLVFHAVPRLVHLPDFVAEVQRMFGPTGMPDWLIIPFAWLIPPVEVALGVLTVLGALTRTVAAASAVWMIALLAGSNLLRDYVQVLTALAYLVVYFLLLQFAELNLVSLDRWVLVGGRRPEDRGQKPDDSGRHSQR